MDTGRTGIWLAIARVLWVVLAVAYVGVLVAGVGPRIAELEDVCSGDACSPLLLAPEEADLLRERGLSTAFYARWSVGPELLLVAVFIVLSVVIFWRRGNRWIGLLVASLLVTFGANVIPDSDEALVRLYPAFATPVAFMDGLAIGILMLTFYVFPDGQFVPRWSRWLTVIVVVLVIGAPISAAFNPLAEEGFGGATGVVTAGYLLGGIISQVYRYRRVSDSAQRQQTKWIIFGFAGIVFTLLGFMIVFFVIDPAPGPLRLTFFMFGFFVVLPFLAALPISFAVSILRYRLWDIDFIVSRALIYGILTAILAAVWAISTTLINGLAEQALGANSAATASLIATVVIVSIFQPVRTGVEDWVSERFSPISRELAGGLNEFESFYLSRTDMPRLLNVILERICALMDNASGAIFLVDESGDYTVTQTLELDAAMLPPKALPSGMHDRWGHARTVEQAEGEIGLLVPLHVDGVHADDVIGLLALGPRAGGRGYSRDERRGLVEFGAQAGKAIHKLRHAADWQSAKQRDGAERA